MVSDDRTRGSARLLDGDRAQLVLIGAVLAALVILGLTTVINTVLFTEDITAATGGSGSVAAEEYDFEVRSASASVVLRLNHGGRNRTAKQLNATIKRNLTNYRRIRQELTAAARDALLDVALDNGSTVYGRRIVQAADANFTNDDNDADWTPVPAGDDALVGRIVLNVDVSETNISGPFVMNITSVPTGRRISYRLQNDNGTGVGNLSLTYDRVWTATPPVTKKCPPAGNRVVLDFGQANAYTGPCGLPTGSPSGFASFRELEQPLEVTFGNASNIVGKYDIALNRSTSVVGSGSANDYRKCWVSPKPPLADPCVAPVVWQANVTVSYVTDTVRYANEHNVTIYEVEP